MATERTILLAYGATSRIVIWVFRFAFTERSTMGRARLSVEVPPKTFHSGHTHWFCLRDHPEQTHHHRQNEGARCRVCQTRQSWSTGSGSARIEGLETANPLGFVEVDASLF